MEKYVIMIVPLLIALMLIRLMLIPLKPILKLGIHSGCGFLCLWLLDSLACFTGIGFPLNAATVLLAGFGGLPGIALMTLLAVLKM